jgi:hypothetical protein
LRFSRYSPVGADVEVQTRNRSSVCVASSVSTPSEHNRHGPYFHLQDFEAIRRSVDDANTPNLNLFLFLFSIGSYLRAQTSAEFSGRVTDPSGNIVPGAQISLTRQGTESAEQRSTNEAGYFFFPDLIPAKYDIRVAKDGFKTVLREGVTIVTADRARLDFQLELGSVAMTVNVSGDTSLLQVSSADVSTSVTSREYDQLPQIQYNRRRSPGTFLYLAPGVQGKIVSAILAGARSTRSSSTCLSMRSVNVS